MNTQREDKAMIGREEGEDIEEFVYLGTTVAKEGGDTEDINKRLSKARRAFFNLKNIWNHRALIGIQKSNCLRPWYDQSCCMVVKHGN